MRLLRRLSYLWHRRRREQDLADEIAWHRTLAEQDQLDAGLPPEDGRRAASFRMGNATLAREAAHHVWVPAALEGAVQDVRYACRGLMRSKTLLVVACLSLGISTGFGTALFSVVNAVVLQPVSASRPASLVRFWIGDGNRISWLNLRDLCEATPGVSCLGYRIEELAWQAGDEPVRIHGQSVSAHYFAALGVEAAQGRVFTAESVREAGDTAVVTHAFWERRLGNDPKAIGRTLVLNGHRYTVIGVLPRGYRSLWGLGVAPSIYLPAGSSARPPTTRRGEAQYQLLGLLAPGQTEAEFRARVAARGAALARADPIDNKALGRVQTFPFHPLGLFISANDQAMRVLVLFATVVVVLVLLLAVVACVNVAGLLVARAAARQREFALRVSIGCGRWRLARLLLAESLLLAVTGIGLGAIGSLWVARLLVAVPLPFPVPFEAEVPTRPQPPRLPRGARRPVDRGGRRRAGAAGVPRLGGRRYRHGAPGSRSPALVGARRAHRRAGRALDGAAGRNDAVRPEPVGGEPHRSRLRRRPCGDRRGRHALRAASTGDVDAFYRAAIGRLKTAPQVTAVSAAAVVPFSHGGPSQQPSGRRPRSSAES